MRMIEYANGRIKKLNVLDIAIIKIANILLGAIVGAFCSRVVKKVWLIFAALAVGISIPAIFKFFKDN